MFIAVIDYGAGNLRSVEKALENLGFKASLTRSKEEIRSASGVILPGVGSFDSAVTELRKNGLESVIEEVIALGKPFLGICLGYQLLLESSEEGKLKGFSVLKGTVKKFTPSPSMPVPHMGWNRLAVRHPSPLTGGIDPGSMVYFAHSYYCDPEDRMIVSTTTEYGVDFASSVSKGKMFGIQFHPEKSGDVGLMMLKNFGGMCCSR